MGKTVALVIDPRDEQYEFEVTGTIDGEEWEAILFESVEEPPNTPGEPSKPKGAVRSPHRPDRHCGPVRQGAEQHAHGAALRALVTKGGGMDCTHEGALERTEDGWFASVPSLEGVYGAGGTVDEACASCSEALRMCIASAIEGGLPFPEPEFGTAPQAVFTVEVDDGYVKATSCMTMRDAAEALGVSIGRVSQLVKGGPLDAVRIDGRRMVTIASVSARTLSVGFLVVGRYRPGWQCVPASRHST